MNFWTVFLAALVANVIMYVIGFFVGCGIGLWQDKKLKEANEEIKRLNQLKQETDVHVERMEAIVKKMQEKADDELLRRQYEEYNL